MKILTLDTNTDLLSACITEETKLVYEKTLYNLKRHSINSMDIIDSVLKESNMTLNDIDGFVISKGPGSFTGLRIAFSIIKAFSYSLNKPMVSLSSLDTLCFRENFNGVVCGVIDALRNEIYINSYLNKEDIKTNLYPGDIININEIKTYIENKHGKDRDILFTGESLDKFHPIINEYFPSAYLNKKPLTSYDYALLGLHKFKLNLIDDSDSSPSYIRVSQAQEMLFKNKENG